MVELFLLFRFYGEPVINIEAYDTEQEYQKYHKSLGVVTRQTLLPS